MQLLRAGILMSNESGHRLYEVRIKADDGQILIFATAAATDEDAIEYAKRMMLPHPCESAEIWVGMKLLRQL